MIHNDKDLETKKQKETQRIHLQHQRQAGKAYELQPCHNLAVEVIGNRFKAVPLKAVPPRLCLRMDLQGRTFKAVPSRLYLFHLLLWLFHPFLCLFHVLPGIFHVRVSPRGRGRCTPFLTLDAAHLLSLL